MKKLVSTVLSIMVLLAFSASAQASNLKYSGKEEIKPILIEDGWNDKYNWKLRHDAVKWDKKMKKKKMHGGKLFRAK